MKLTLEHEGRTVTIRRPGDGDLNDLVDMFRDALIAVEFSREAADRVQIVEDGE